MDRTTFENAARQQNLAAAARRAEARATNAPCVIVEMFAFGATPYCTAHGVMGACEFSAVKS